jgi:hypothetical protein
MGSLSEKRDPLSIQIEARRNLRVVVSSYKSLAYLGEDHPCQSSEEPLRGDQDRHHNPIQNGNTGQHPGNNRIGLRVGPSLRKPFHGNEGSNLLKFRVSCEDRGFKTEGCRGGKAVGIRDRIGGLDLRSLPDQSAIRQNDLDGKAKKILQEFLCSHRPDRTDSLVVNLSQIDLII